MIENTVADILMTQFTLKVSFSEFQVVKENLQISQIKQRDWRQKPNILALTFESETR
jgi:hypothetical protein